MPPKRAAATRSAAASKRAGTAPTTATKANISSKRKAIDEDDDTSAPKNKRARSQPLAAPKAKTPPQAPSTKASTKNAIKKNTTLKKVTPVPRDTNKHGRLLNAIGRLCIINELFSDSKPTPKRGRPAKRDTTAEETENEAPPPPAKRTIKTAAKPKTAPKAPKAPKVSKTTKPLPVLNEPPKALLEVLVCGEGENGELGLGSAKGQTGVKRPRLNPLLSVNDAGVVQVACGGMHALALTHDNRILSWGVNDQGTLGRDTTWEGGLRDMDVDSDSEDSDNGETGLNPYESTPTAIDSSGFPEGTRFAAVAAGDSCSFALTDTGLVYGWGTFRANEGILGFSQEVEVQRRPALVRELKNITQLACGANHVLALDKDGNTWAWGAGQQMQLGRKPVERTRATGLTPRPLGLPKKQITHVACGSYHSFAIDKKDNVWAWGLNSFGECAIEQDAGEAEAVVGKPTKIPHLCGQGIISLDAGEHHSVSVDEAGTMRVWGRADGGQLGITVDEMPDECVVKDESGRVRIVIRPAAVDAIGSPVRMAAAAGDHTLAVTKGGHAWSWGFSATYQTGQGTDDDVMKATRIENTATRERKILWAGAGGQYSVLAAVTGAQDVEMSG